MKLVRSMTTEVVHRPECKFQGRNTKPWVYATTRTFEEVIVDSRIYPWLHLCRFCIGFCHCKRCEPAVTYA